MGGERGGPGGEQELDHGELRNGRRIKGSFLLPIDFTGACFTPRYVFHVQNGYPYNLI